MKEGKTGTGGMKKRRRSSAKVQRQCRTYLDREKAPMQCLTELKKWVVVRCIIDEVVYFTETLGNFVSLSENTRAYNSLTAEEEFDYFHMMYEREKIHGSQKFDKFEGWKFTKYEFDDDDDDNDYVQRIEDVNVDHPSDNWSLKTQIYCECTRLCRLIKSKRDAIGETIQKMITLEKALASEMRF